MWALRQLSPIEIAHLLNISQILVQFYALLSQSLQRQMWWLSLLPKTTIQWSPEQIEAGQWIYGFVAKNSTSWRWHLQLFYLDRSGLSNLAESYVSSILKVKVLFANRRNIFINDANVFKANLFLGFSAFQCASRWEVKVHVSHLRVAVNRHKNSVFNTFNH